MSNTYLTEPFLVLKQSRIVLPFQNKLLWLQILLSIFGFGILQAQSPQDGHFLLEKADNFPKMEKDSSVFFLMRAIKIFEQEADTINYLKALIKLEEKYENIKNLKLADSLLHHNWKLSQTYLDPKNSDHVEVYCSSADGLASMYLLKGFFIKSLDLFDHIIGICKESDSIQIGPLASYYAKSAVAQRRIGDFFQAARYNQNSLQLISGAGIDNPERYASIYFNMGNVYSTVNIDSALKYYRLSEKFLSHPSIEKAIQKRYQGFITRGKGASFSYHNRLDSALNYSLNALNTANQFTTKKDSFNILSNLGSLYTKLENITQAERYLLQAQQLLDSPWKGKAWDIEQANKSNLNLFWGNIYQSKGNFFQANSYYEKALQLTCNVPLSRDINATNFSNKVTSLMVIKEKILNLNLLKGNSNLIEALWLTDLAIDLARSIRQDFITEGAKLKLPQKSHTLYENGIDIAHQLYESEKSKDYLEAGFKYIEFNKSLLLYESLQEKEAQMGLPKHIRIKEERFKRDISFYEKFLFDSKSEIKDEKTEAFRKELFSKRQAYSLFVDSLEKKFPSYYRQKYKMNLASLEALRKELSPQQAFIQYFLGDSLIFILGIHPEHIVFKSLPLTDSLFRRIKNYPEALTLLEEIEPQISGEEYGKNAYILQRLLVEAVLEDLPNNVQSLILSPDGVLNYLPFETFLTGFPQKGEKFSEFPFLIKSHSISYTHSATHWLEQQEQNHDHQNHDRSVKQWLGFAPTYKENQITKEVAPLALDRFLTRDGSVQLPFAHKEIEQISQLANGRALYSTKALESNFHLQADQYNIIHLATHGLIEDQQPMYSKLVFASESDSLYDGYLHAYEIYNMQLPADLVVLSACNTGIGKLEKGEGIMSLSRAFFYAGVKSLVMSLWKVSDESTSELMVYFYEGLKQGLPKDRALQHAKLRYLENQEVALKSHPYFWAGFVLKGNAEPVAFKSPMNTWIFGVLGLLLLSLGAGVFWIWKSRS
ncbi:MAG: CHAT domain-containing tetratricopeptide repeat protein [Bacteroidota bacterium]